MHKISTRMVCVNGKHPRFSGSASTVTFILTCPVGKSQYVIFYLLNPLLRSVSDLEQAKCDNCSPKGQHGIHPFSNPKFTVLQFQETNNATQKREIFSSLVKFTCRRSAVLTVTFLSSIF